MTKRWIRLVRSAAQAAMAAEPDSVAKRARANLPRSNPDLAVGLAGFEAARTAFNADVVAHCASHADALADVAAVKGMGAAGDSDNTTYYSADKIHPIGPGHALLEPVYRAAVASQL